MVLICIIDFNFNYLDQNIEISFLNIYNIKKISTFTESLVAGIVIALIGLIVTYISMYISSKEKTVNFQHWAAVALSYFITGFIYQYFIGCTNIKMYINLTGLQ